MPLHILGFCAEDEHRRFLRQCPAFERLLTEDGLPLRKCWLSVSRSERRRRRRKRREYPMRRWKLSVLDLESMTRWEQRSAARDEMLAATDTPLPPGTWRKAMTSVVRGST